MLERFAGAHTELLPKDLKEWDWIASARAPYLYGAAGVGKTFAAVAMREAARRAYPQLDIRFISLARLFKMKRDSIGNPNNGFVDINWKKVDAVVFDDIDKLRITEWVKEELFVIIDTLYGRCVPTLITSNLYPQQVQGYFGTFVADRLREMCKSYHLTGGSRRAINSSQSSKEEIKAWQQNRSSILHSTDAKSGNGLPEVPECPHGMPARMVSVSE
jgi:DNA replication protein DnaC